MQKRILLAASVSLLLLGAGPLRAAPLTFVSGNGNDSNNCLTPATACREIGGIFGADSKTDPAGTIHVLPGAYQPFQLNAVGSINILADQRQASINGSIAAPCCYTHGSASIHVTAGAGIVRIRGFTLGKSDNGLAVDSGIAIFGGGTISDAIHLENCTFKPGTGGGNAGVEIATNGLGEVYISNSSFQGPGVGVLIKPLAGGSARVVLNDVNIENAGAGVYLDAKATNGVNRISIRDTMIGNGGGLILLEDANG